MKKQYTRFYYKGGEIAASATQDTPYKGAHEPVHLDSSFTRIDVVMELDDHGHVDAQKLMDELRIDEAGRVKVKIDKPAKERLFTLRKVFDTNGHEVPHR